MALINWMATTRKTLASTYNLLGIVFHARFLGYIIKLQGLLFKDFGEFWSVKVF